VAAALFSAKLDAKKGGTASIRIYSLSLAIVSNSSRWNAQKKAEEREKNFIKDNVILYTKIKCNPWKRY
jgi:hypothetical protein